MYGSYFRLSSRLRSSMMSAAVVVVFSARIAARVTARVAAWIARRSCARVAFILFIGHFSAVFKRVGRTNLFREQCRECGADCVLLRFQRDESRGKYAELHRHNDFLLTCYALQRYKIRIKQGLEISRFF